MATARLARASDSVSNRLAGDHPLGRTITVAAALLVGLIAAVSLAAEAWRGSGSGLAGGLGPIGTLHSALLTNNQVYYGTLERTGAGFVVLTGVFYVQVTTDAQTNERVNKLVERRANDWHAPLNMTIPVEKIVFMEAIGPDSSVAKLIAQAKAGVTIQ
jgi:hypothetical protein